MAEQETIDVSGEGLYEHHTGNRDCTAGWCGVIPGEYPMECHCGGLIHADFGDESEDGYWVYTRCDRCDEPAPGML